MTPQTLIFLAIGALVGVCSGIFGIGGGVILVPILVLGFGFAQITATGVSLTALLLPVGALGVWEYWRSGRLTSADVRVGLLIAVGIFLGTFVGARLAGHLPENVLRKGFAVLMAGVAIKLWLA